MENRQKARGSTVQCESFIGLRGQIIVDTGLWCLRVMDGVTPGGFIVPNEAGINTLIQEFIDADELVIDSVTGLTAALAALDARLDVIEADGWVSSNRIANGAITQLKYGNSSIPTAALANGTILEQHINGAQIGSSRIKPLNIGGYHIADATIGPEKLAGGGGGVYAGIGAYTVDTAYSYPGPGGTTSGGNLVTPMSGTWRQMSAAILWAGGGSISGALWVRVG